MEKKKTYLVTGGAGFIGSHLCEKIISQGHRVICFDNLLTGSLENLSSLQKNSRFSFINGDANKLEDLAPVFKNNKLDGVFHYASVIGVKRTMENPLSMLNDIEGIKNVASLAVTHGKPKIIFASSSEVYGEPQQFPEREDGAINPSNPYSYGVIKLLGERFFSAVCKKV
jgi:UDP-glucuronate decarboxylase